MVHIETGFAISTIKKHLKNLEEKGAITSSLCTFHENTNVYEITREADLFIS